jgi:hypothetical protein
LALQRSARFDERDRQVLAQAGTYQIGFVLVSLAIWLVALGQHFHAEGAVPMVYLYLMFGSIVMISFIGQSDQRAAFCTWRNNATAARDRRWLLAPDHRAAGAGTLLAFADARVPDRKAFRRDSRFGV